ncbi:MAG: alpha/beta hydrolase [Planctomycetaceae bacterium]|nr:alpha/beta hydrolase [Planctomycetaceae bacterium]
MTDAPSPSPPPSPPNTAPAKADSLLTRRTKKILRLLVICYIVILTVLGFFQRKLLYHPSTADALPVAEHQKATAGFESCQDVQMTCGNGETIHGWLLQQQSDVKRPLVLYFHGNARNRSDRGPWYELLRQAGLDVLAIDYQGYGDSGGQTTEDTIEQSCDATWQYAISELGYQPAELGIAGTSLGGAAAVYLAERQSQAETPPAFLFVTATFSSMGDVASSLYWWLPVRALLVDTFPSAERAARVTCPVLVMHGDQDTLVDQKFGQRLFEAFPKQSSSAVPRQWVNLTDIGHKDIVAKGQRMILSGIRKLLEDSRAVRVDGDQQTADDPVTAPDE